MNRNMFLITLFLILISSVNCQQNNNFFGEWIGVVEDEYFIIEFQKERFIIKEISGEIANTGFYELDGNVIYIIDDSGNREEFGSYLGNDTLSISDSTFERYRPNKTSIIGKYICSDGIITEIEILDRTNIILRGGMVGYRTTLPGKYEIVQGKLIVNINGDMAIYQVNKDGSLTGETFGMTGDYIKIK